MGTGYIFQHSEAYSRPLEFVIMAVVGLLVALALAMHGR